MDALAAIIFFGFPLVGLFVGLMSAGGMIVNWHRVTPPETHYIAARARPVPVDATDERWLNELAALQLPYRHTVC